MAPPEEKQHGTRRTPGTDETPGTPGTKDARTTSSTPKPGNTTHATHGTTETDDTHETPRTSGTHDTHETPGQRTPRTNWAGTYTYTARAIVEPDTLDEVQRLVRDSRRVRALGTGHSFNALPDAEVLVHLGRIPSDPVIDEAGGTVTVGGATRYGDLARFLQSHGHALHNLGSLPHISVGGATATGTHGSGDANGSLSSAVAGLEIVTADGSLARVYRSTPGFEGMVVGLGAFGIVSRVTLDIRPTFDVRQDAFVGLLWERLLGDFDAIMSAAYSVSVLTMWSGDTVDHLWLKSVVEKSPPDVMDAVGADAVRGDLVAAHVSAAAEHLDAVAAHVGAVAAPAAALFDEQPSNMTQFGGVSGPWSERLPHFRLDSTPSVGAEIQSEYLVPRSRIVEALTELRRIGRRIDNVLLISEFRTVAADPLWLSGAADRDVVGVHFTFAPDPARVNAILPAIEDILIPLGGRPHWGKHFLATADTIAPLYPRLPEWIELAQTIDPTGKFRNRFLEERVFGG
jgi:xylitol oxidase